MEINEIIKCSLDELCEQIDTFFAARYKDKISAVLTARPISITGEGIVRLKGAAEHISKRLNRISEIVYPDLPYYDKPTFSSRIGLIDTATKDCKSSGWWQKIINVFGGKKK